MQFGKIKLMFFTIVLLSNTSITAAKPTAFLHSRLSLWDKRLNRVVTERSLFRVNTKYIQSNWHYFRHSTVNCTRPKYDRRSWWV